MIHYTNDNILYHITIQDNENGSGDKDAWIDIILQKYDEQIIREFNTDHIKYSFPIAIWNNPEFQQKFMYLELSY